MENNSFIFGVVTGAVAVIAIIVLIKQLSNSKGGSLLELRRDNSGNIVEILEHDI
jgi:hypothetical protein